MLARGDDHRRHAVHHDVAVEQAQRVGDQRSIEVLLQRERIPVGGVGVSRRPRALGDHQPAVVGTSQPVPLHVATGHQGERSVRAAAGDAGEVIARRPVVVLGDRLEPPGPEDIACQHEDVGRVACLHCVHGVLQHVDARGPRRPGVHDPAEPETEPHCDVDRSVRRQRERGDREAVDLVAGHARVG